MFLKEFVNSAYDKLRNASIGVFFSGFFEFVFIFRRHVDSGFVVMLFIIFLIIFHFFIGHYYTP